LESSFIHDGNITDTPDEFRIVTKPYAGYDWFCLRSLDDTLKGKIWFISDSFFELNVTDAYIESRVLYLTLRKKGKTSKCELYVNLLPMELLQNVAYKLNSSDVYKVNIITTHKNFWKDMVRRFYPKYYKDLFSTKMKWNWCKVYDVVKKDNGAIYECTNANKRVLDDITKSSDVSLIIIAILNIDKDLLKYIVKLRVSLKRDFDWWTIFSWLRDVEKGRCRFATSYIEYYDVFYITLNILYDRPTFSIFEDVCYDDYIPSSGLECLASLYLHKRSLLDALRVDVLKMISSTCDMSEYRLLKLYILERS
jgi:hypothetical protein